MKRKILSLFWELGTSLGYIEHDRVIKWIMSRDFGSGLCKASYEVLWFVIFGVVQLIDVDQKNRSMDCFTDLMIPLVSYP